MLSTAAEAGKAIVVAAIGCDRIKDLALDNTILGEENFQTGARRRRTTDIDRTAQIIFNSRTIVHAIGGAKVRHVKRSRGFHHAEGFTTEVDIVFDYEAKIPLVDIKGAKSAAVDRIFLAVLEVYPDIDFLIIRVAHTHGIGAVIVEGAIKFAIHGNGPGIAVIVHIRCSAVITGYFYGRIEHAFSSNEA